MWKLTYRNNSHLFQLTQSSLSGHCQVGFRWTTVFFSLSKWPLNGPWELPVESSVSQKCKNWPSWTYLAVYIAADSPVPWWWSCEPEALSTTSFIQNKWRLFLQIDSTFHYVFMTCYLCSTNWCLAIIFSHSHWPTLLISGWQTCTTLTIQVGSASLSSSCWV